MSRKNSQDYTDGYNEAVRTRVKDACRAALDAHPNLHDIASEVAKNLGRDHGRKQRIVQRSPHVFAAMDAEEIGKASSRELAGRELKELGIDAGDNDPLAILDAHHAGRQFARDGQRLPGNPITGGNDTPMSGNKLVGNGMDSANPSYLDKYLHSGE